MLPVVRRSTRTGIGPVVATIVLFAAPGQAQRQVEIQSMPPGDPLHQGQSSAARAGNGAASYGPGLGEYVPPGDCIGDLFPVRSFELGERSYAVMTADMDSDGDLDAVTTDTYGTVTISMNAGDGSFGNPVTSEVVGESWGIACADMDGDGAPDVVVIDANGDSVSVLMNAGDGSISVHGKYGAGSRPRSVVIGDFDGDGDADVLTGGDSLSVLLNAGDGTLGPNAQYLSSDDGKYVAIADVDGDGDLDIVASNWSDLSISILVNAGDGTFVDQPAIDLGMRPSDVGCADLDGDGDQDIVTTVGAQRVQVRLNAGDGTFPTSQLFFLGAGNGAREIEIADFDSDGDLDLLIASDNDDDGCANQQVDNFHLLFNSGNGTFGAPTSFLIDAAPSYSLSGFTTADLDNDGDQDILVGNFLGDTISVHLNPGGGEFLTHGQYSMRRGPAGCSSEYYPVGMTSGDYDGDGNLDIAVIDRLDDRIGVLLNGGNGAFLDVERYDIHPLANPYTIVSGDIDGDGDVDLLAPDYLHPNVYVYLNLGDGTFGPYSTFPIGDDNTESLALSDFDGDGDLDLVTPSRNGAVVWLQLNAGNGVFGAPVSIPAGGATHRVLAVDVDGDGAMDLVATHRGPVTTAVLRNLGSGMFAAPVQYPGGITATGRSALAAADIDGDGDQDLLTRGTGIGLHVLQNQGDGTYLPFGQPHLTRPPSGAPWHERVSIATADVDSDGDLDVITTAYSFPGDGFLHGVEVLLNAGDGTFSPRIRYGIGGQPTAVGTADVNGDGYLDVLTTNDENDTLSVFLTRCR